MFITLLLISQVGCEWVEISQQHYLKPVIPVRPTHNYPSLTTIGRVEVERVTKGNRIYINHSLPEYNWNKGTVFEIESDSGGSKSKINSRADILKHENKNNKPQSLTKQDLVQKDRNKATEEPFKIDHKFQNMGIRRVQLLGTEELPIRMSPENYRYEDKSIEVLNLSAIDDTTEEDISATVKQNESISNKENFKIPVSSTVTSVDRLKPHINRLSENVSKNTEKVKSNNKSNKHTHVMDVFTDDIETEDSIQKVPGNSFVKRVQIAIDTDEAPVKKNDSKTIAPIKASSAKPDLIRKEVTFWEDEIKPSENVYQVSNIGQIPRVQFLHSTNKAPADKNKPNRIDFQNYDFNKAPNVANYETITQVSVQENKDKEKSKDKIDQVLDKQLQTSTTEKVGKTEKNRYNNYAPIKRRPNPDEVMIEEILKDDDVHLGGNVHIIPHIGIVKRVQIKKKENILATSVKSEKVIKENKPNLPELSIHKNVDKEETIRDKEDIHKNVNGATTDNVRQKQMSSSNEVPLVTTETIKRNNYVAAKRPNPDVVNKHKQFYPIDFSDEENPTFVTKKEIHELGHDFRRTQVSSTEEVPLLTTKKMKRIHFVASKKPNPFIEKENKNNNPTEVLYEHKPTFTNKEEPASDYEFKTSTTSGYFETFTTKVDIKEPQQKDTTNNPGHDLHETEPEQYKQTTENKEAPNIDTVTNDTKANNMENVVKIIKVVADTISRNTRRNFKSKMRYLEDLRDTILINIEDRIESAFPDDDAGHRKSRSVHASPRGHIEFPSSEGALMTISFLTFAVFLIKLVLQVIQTYKNKTMMVPVMATVGRAALRKLRARN